MTAGRQRKGSAAEVEGVAQIQRDLNGLHLLRGQAEAM